MATILPADGGGRFGVPRRVRPWRFSCSFLSGVRLSAVSVPLSGTKFAGPLAALHLPLSLPRALLSFSLTGKGLFTALFISLSVGNTQAELPTGETGSSEGWREQPVCISLNKGSAPGLGLRSKPAPEGLPAPQALSPAEIGSLEGRMWSSLTTGDVLIKDLTAKVH